MSECEHVKIETLYQYDKKKNRTLLWACPDCRMQFEPRGLADAQLQSENASLKRENKAMKSIASGMRALLLNLGYSEDDIASRFGKKEALLTKEEQGDG